MKKNKIIFFSVLGVLITLITVLNPFTDHAAYHGFADDRNLCSVNNFWNVISNLPFLIFGLWGVKVSLEKKPSLGASFPAWMAFFLGVTLVCFGSSYYHLEPNDFRLVWDRFPMTLGFMGLFCAFMEEFVFKNFCKKYLYPLLAFGLVSVVIWYQLGELRPYVLVQGGPIVLLLVFIGVIKGRWQEKMPYLLGVLCYVLAKVVEATDVQIYQALGEQFSGHSLKHIVASLSAYIFILKIKKA